MNIELTSQQRIRSQALIQYIKNNMRDAVIPFSQFMEWALYAPELGYYSASDDIIGEQGDFVTAPNLTPLFGQAFSRAFLPIFAECGSAAILELGAGQGCFAKAVLDALRDMGVKDVRYVIVEKSAALQARQQNELKDYAVEWLSDLPLQFSGVVFANEVFDALPVECFQVQENKIIQRAVRMSDESFAWAEMPAFTADFERALPKLNSFLHSQSWPENYVSEWHGEAEQFIVRLAAMLQTGSIVLVDYGYAERDYYRRERHLGTLMCFIQHQKHDNPFLFPGVQDITAHVNFSSLAEVGCDHQLQLSGYTSQAMCLLGLGIESLAQQSMKQLSAKEQADVAQALKILLLPNQMGDRIRCMMFNKNHSLVVPAFQLRDMRWEL